MEARDAIAAVERWLPAGEQGFLVDHEQVLRVPEGWYVPYDSPKDPLVPRPALIVREDGALRRPDLSPDGTRPSVPVPAAGEEDWREILEPEFENSGVAYLGVPITAVMGWQKYVDGTSAEEIRANPEYRPGPERLGYPAIDTPLDYLLSCLKTGRYDRSSYLAGLLSAEVLLPLDAEDRSPEGVVYSSRRRLPAGTAKWLRTDVLSFMDFNPDVGLLINPDSFPSDRVSAGELATARASWPDFRPSDPVVEVSPERPPGKSLRRDADGVDFEWHRITGAFVGFAMGEALGRAVDTSSAKEIEERLDSGLTIGRPGPLTEQLLFHTEGLLRALPAPVTSALMTTGVRSLRRWRDRDEGWLAKVADLSGRPPLWTPSADDVSLLIPGLAAALSGGGPDTTPDTAARVGRLLAAGLGANRDTADATAAVAILFAHLFRRESSMYPPYIHIQRLLATEAVSGRVAGALANAARTRLDLTRPDHEELDSIGTGGTALDALGRAMVAVTRRFHDPHWTLYSAVIHSGHSAITGAIAGAVLGARSGVSGLPAAWLRRLELRDLVKTVADDGFRHFSANPPLQDDRYAKDWESRYPREVL
ncbi:ADP-ribosylglycohydrolase family protein [Amycolatopsis pigmentata]|uniref:ADP-ribosylglycohydrolase family protein n=1 Tax=Amycolatopsis pigmentata TaxID=450801 RepID=A0ABW5FID7_9PSEU